MENFSFLKTAENPSQKIFDKLENSWYNANVDRRLPVDEWMY